jgi:hypothetical protein
LNGFGQHSAWEHPLRFLSGSRNISGRNGESTEMPAGHCAAVIAPCRSDKTRTEPEKTVVQITGRRVIDRSRSAALVFLYYFVTSSLFPASNIHSGRFYYPSRRCLRELRITVRTGYKPYVSMLTELFPS